MVKNLGEGGGKFVRSGVEERPEVGWQVLYDRLYDPTIQFEMVMSGMCKPTVGSMTRLMIRRDDSLLH